MPRGIIVLVLLALGATGLAQDARVRIAINTARDVAASGRFEHALRIIDQSLVSYPDDPDLLAVRRQFVDAAAHAAGNPVVRLGTAVRLPTIANQLAEPGKDFTTGTARIAMIWIAPGSFLMRNPFGSDDDTFVTLSRGYWLGRTEVTQEQLQAVMQHLPPQSFFRGSDRPVDRISWLSAMEFAAKMTEHERASGRLPAGYEYTLPTEAQWEYACRAGNQGVRVEDLAAVAWFEANSNRQTHPVGQKQPNGWGLYDMLGNVAEWCLDGFHGYPGGRVTDLMIGYDGPSAAMARMVRGGAWASTVGECRFGRRHQYMLNSSQAGIGFRLALAPTSTPTPTKN
jgi:formylglycine-generating enzyme required for sulfatase activity